MLKDEGPPRAEGGHRKAEMGKASHRKQTVKSWRQEQARTFGEAAPILQRSVQMPQVGKTTGLQVARKEGEEEKVQEQRPLQQAEDPPPCCHSSTSAYPSLLPQRGAQHSAATVLQGEGQSND